MGEASNTIRVLLMLDGKQYAAELKTADQQTLDFGKSAGGVGAQLDLLKGAALGVAGGFSALTAVQLLPAFIKNGEAINQLRERLEATTGSSQAARQEMAYIVQQADRLGTRIRDTADQYTTLAATTRGSNLEGRATREIYEGIAEAAARMNLEQDKTTQVFDAVEKIARRGYATMGDYTGVIGKQLPQALTVTAQALGVTRGEFEEMLRSGGAAADDVLPALARGFREAFGTSAQTEIRGTGQNLNRVYNEIALIASTVGGPLNDGLGVTLGMMADILKLSREKPGELFAVLFGGGLVGGIEFAVANRRDGANASQGAADTSRIFRASPTGGMFDTDGLLGPAANNSRWDGTAAPFMRSTALSDEQQKSLDIQRESLALTRLQSNEEKAVYQITVGRYRDESKQAKDLILERAKLLDLQQREKEEASAAERVRRQASADQQRQRQQDLTASIRAEEQTREATREAQLRQLVMRNELQTGERLTGAAEELFVLQNKARIVTGESLEDELAKAAALEEQIRQRRQLESELDRFTRQSGGGQASEFRRADPRRLENQRSLQGIDVAQNAAITAEQERYDARLEQLESFNKARLLNEDDYRRRSATEEAEHVARIQAINQAAHDSRLELLQDQLNVSASIFSDIADVALLFGRKGFEAYRAFSIAQATASMIAGAVGAFSRASEAYPPPYGQIVGGIAAAAVVASGLVQIGRIRNQSYGAGREYGGATRAGGMYRFAEGGKPELYKSGNDYYLATGSQGGMAIPAKAANDSGVRMDVSIFNYGSERVTTRQLSDMQIQVMVGQAAEAGAMMAEQRIAGGIRSGRSPVAGAISARYRVAGQAVR